MGRRGSALDPAGGAYSAPPDLLAGFREGPRKRNGETVVKGRRVRGEGEIVKSGEEGGI